MNPWIILGTVCVLAFLLLTYFSIQTLLSLQNFMKTVVSILQNRDKQIEEVLHKITETTEKINEAADSILFIKNLISSIFSGNPVNLLGSLFRKKKG